MIEGPFGNPPAMIPPHVTRRLLALARRCALVGLALLVSASASAAGPPRSFSGRCVGVTDGDTLTVLQGRVPVKIRLEGIDAPERRQPFGRAAKSALARLVYNRQVQVRGADLDRYRRLLARVEVDGTDASLHLAQLGLAWHFKKYSDDAELATAERSARLRRLGLWSSPAPEPPWDYRHRTSR